MDSPDYGGKIEYDAQIDRPDNEGKPGARGVSRIGRANPRTQAILKALQLFVFLTHNQSNKARSDTGLEGSPSANRCHPWSG